MHLLKTLIEKWEHRAQSCTPVPDGLSECIKDAKLTVARATEMNYQMKTLDTVLLFGKYKMKKIWEIIDTDPRYICWCIDNIEGFRLDELAHNYLIEKEK